MTELKINAIEKEFIFNLIKGGLVPKLALEMKNLDVDVQKFKDVGIIKETNFMGRCYQISDDYANKSVNGEVSGGWFRINNIKFIIKK